MSPVFIAATALLGGGADTVIGEGRPAGLTMRATAAATGLSDSFGSRPFGRLKCDSRMILPPLPAISRMVRAVRSMRDDVGNLAAGHRHVEVDAKEHALSFDVGVVE